jgi:hypothetical protein
LAALGNVRAEPALEAARTLLWAWVGNADPVLAATALDSLGRLGRAVIG